MPRNSNGQFVLPAGNPVVPSTLITTSWANTTMNDLALGLTESLAINGSSVPIANLPMGGFRHTNVGAPVASNEYQTAGYAQQWLLNRVTAVTEPTANQYQGNLALGQTTFVDGQVIQIMFPTTNTGAATLNINGAGAFPIQRTDGTPIPNNTLIAGSHYLLVWDFGGAAWRFPGAQVTQPILDATYVLKSGDTMTGYLNLNANPNNEASLQAAPAQWVISKINAAVGTCVPLGGGTMTGLLTLSGNPTNENSLQAAPASWVLGKIAGATTGVASWNTRTGNVTMTGADVTSALGYTPVSKAGDTMGGALYGPQFFATSGGPGLVTKRPTDSADANYLAGYGEASTLQWYVGNGGAGTELTISNAAPASNIILNTAAGAVLIALAAKSAVSVGGDATLYDASSSFQVVNGNLNMQAAAGDARSIGFQTGNRFVYDGASVSYYGMTLFDGATLGVNSLSLSAAGKLALLASGTAVAVLSSAGMALTAASVAGALSVGGAITGKSFTPAGASASISGAVSADFNTAQLFRYTLTAAAQVTVANIPVGAVMRIIAIDTNNVLTFTNVAWPNGDVPDFTTGPLKQAIIVITNSGTGNLATMTAY